MCPVLSDAAIRKAKPKEKPYKMYDIGGLFLLVTPSKKEELPPGPGGKWWRFKYRFQGKEKQLSFGTYPEVSLALARERRDAARKQVATGIDPSVYRREEKEQWSGSGSFEEVAREWIELKSPGWSPSHINKTTSILEKDVFPYIGSRHIGEITPPEILAVLRRIDTRTPVTARKAYSTCRQIFFNAIASGKATTNPVDGLSVLLSPRQVKHMAAPTDPTEVGRLLRAMATYTGSFPVRCALMLSPIFFIRPGTLRGMEWQDIDLEKAEWRIPIEQLKRRQTEKDYRRGQIAHIVPLPRQAVEILRDLYQLTGSGRFVFPGVRDRNKCISDNTVRSALRGMGFTGDEITPHGFRHMASTLLHELGYSSHLVEKQMAHADKNKIRAVYNHAEYLPERRKMMQAWADYLDQLAAGEENKIIPIGSVR
ncbi:MAG: tyrosine-type recombinase/integrase [Desulfobulbaceae bacterium]|nr:tyrosine-type recombinase/integrase [Desulfobulbaceae bacterium]